MEGLKTAFGQFVLARLKFGEMSPVAFMRPLVVNPRL